METFVIGSDNDEFYKADKTDSTQFDTGSGKKEIVERLETCIFFCPLSVLHHFSRRRTTL